MSEIGKKWLYVVGIGESGIAGLSEDARTVVAQAAHVFGGKRHLELARDIIAGKASAWPTPFSIAPVVALRGQPVCVLASGDPFCFGVGATLARDIAASEMTVLPAPSAFSLAASRLGWALQETETVSLHGRPAELLSPLLHPNRRIIALTSDAEAPANIAALITRRGFGSSRVTVLEALGGPDQQIRSSLANCFSLANVNPLNVLAIEVRADPQAKLLPLTAGMRDALFETDGQLTKREVRAVTLAALAPCRGQLLWDIGAGSGSIAVEWMLADPSMRAIAIEQDRVRVARIASNARNCGVPGLLVIEGEAPHALSGLETPDAIFVGGGGSAPGVLPSAISALRQGGRLVANAVTLEMETVLLESHARLGGELTRIAISRAEPVGSMTGWRSAMPVTQWSWVKP